MSQLAKYKKLLFAFGIALIALSLILVFNRQSQHVSEEEFSLWIGEEQVLVFEIADDIQERQVGLSGRKGLEEGTGVLFVFPGEDTHGIWMKDMLFSIDIIWLSSDFEVLNFKEDATPESYPTVFTPTSPARYVIEVETGFVEQYSIKIGEILDIRKEIIEK